MTTNYKLQTTNYKRGAALLIAVLMTGVMLSVGLGVYQRTYKELYFSSFWKQTQLAFAAADSGFECALYWDLHSMGATSADCFNNPVVGWNPSANMPANFEVGTFSGCARVSIMKPSPNNNPYTNPLVQYSTRIESRGYNVACSDIDTNPRVVERALSIDY